MKDKTIAAYFEEDHRRLDHLFEMFQQMKSVEPENSKKFFQKFKEGLERHILWEEQILFPIFEQKTGMSGQGPTVVMCAEHQEIKRLLAEIDDGIRAGNNPPDNLEQTLLIVLKGHNVKEEEVLYPLIDQSVSIDECEEVLKKTFGNENKNCSCCGIVE